MINKSIYESMEILAMFFSCWVLFFTVLNFSKILKRMKNSGDAQSHNTFFVEAAGIPLTLMHSVCFVKALMLSDWASAMLFLWWGPGFLYIATLYLSRVKQGRSINWGPYKRIISWLCKVNYLLFVVIYFYYECYGMIYVFSVWIINDQVMMLWLSDDADRTRRTFHDYWFIRICYPLGLVVPFIFELPMSLLWQAYSIVLFGCWALGIRKVIKEGKFMTVPEDQGLLRNMAYFPEKEVTDDQCSENG
jgi:hypothetical protein